MKIFSKINICIFVLCCLLSLSACIQLPQLMTPKKRTGELWKGHASGTMDFDFDFYLNHTDKEGVSLINGDMYFKISSSFYGPGSCKAYFNGRTKDGMIKMNVSGHCVVQNGSSKIRGEMIGSIATDQAFGTCKLYHTGGSETVEWTAKKATE
ncbi:MAG: hypothetical protein U9O82_14325 [Thermodesulfobacteriota bacterium]|nr:hypothetical protein [Thermodesulfobacteriota bacterium]